MGTVIYESALKQLNTKYLHTYLRSLYRVLITQCIVVFALHILTLVGILHNKTYCTETKQYQQYRHTNIIDNNNKHKQQHKCTIVHAWTCSRCACVRACMHTYANTYIVGG